MDCTSYQSSLTGGELLPWPRLFLRETDWSLYPFLFNHRYEDTLTVFVIFSVNWTENHASCFYYPTVSFPLSGTQALSMSLSLTLSLTLSLSLSPPLPPPPLSLYSHTYLSIPVSHKETDPLKSLYFLNRILTQNADSTGAL